MSATTPDTVNEEYARLQQTLLRSNSVHRDEYFRELTRQVDLRREQIIEGIHDYSDSLLKQIDEWKRQPGEVKTFSPCPRLRQRIDLCRQKVEDLNEAHQHPSRVPSYCGFPTGKMLDLLAVTSEECELSLLDNKVYSFNAGDCLSRLPVVFGHLGVCSQDRPNIRGWQLFDSHQNSIFAIRFGKEGTLTSCSADRTIKTWDISTGKCLNSVEWNTMDDRTVIREGIFEWNTMDDRTVIREGIFNRSVRINKAIFDGCGLIATYTNEESHAVSIWAEDTGLLVKTIVGHTDTIRDIAFDGKGLLASCSQDRTIRICDVASGDCISIFRPRVNHSRKRAADNLPPAKGDLQGDVFRVLFDGTGILATTDHSIVRLWDVVTGKCRVLYEGELVGLGWYNHGSAMAFDGCGNIALAMGGSSLNIRVYDTSTLTLIKSIPVGLAHINPSSTWSIGFDGRGHIVRSANDGEIQIYDTVSGELVNKLKVEAPAAWDKIWRHLVISDNGLLAGTCSGKTEGSIRMWLY